MAAAQIVSTVMQAVGGAIQSYGQISGGEQQYKVAKMQASAATYEGKMQNLEMQQNAWQWQREGYRVKSTQMVSAATAGVSLDSESFQNIVSETMASFEYDVQAMLKQGEIYQLFGDATATMFKAQGRIQRAAGYLDAFTTQINTASGIMQTWGGGGGGAGGIMGGS